MACRIYEYMRSTDTKTNIVYHQPACERGITDARKIDADFGWQPRFHDHIIRDEISFYRISEYIKNNPFNWDADEHNPRKPGKS
jgi:hypothetical protein